MRRVFYSFHYDRDIWRVSQVRNSGVIEGIEPSNRIIDHADWEQIKRSGEAAVRNWIEEQLKGASVTAVLIGAETYNRKWVQYEIQRSYDLGKGIVGVRIHGLRDQAGNTDTFGLNPLDAVTYPVMIGSTPLSLPLSRKFKTYDYAAQDGYSNLASWVEEAAKIAGR